MRLIRYVATSQLLPILAVGLLAACSPQQNLACPYTDEAPQADSGCFVVHQQKLLVVKQRSGRLNFPAGGAKRGEAPRCTAWRETLEETGLEAEVGNLLTTMPNGFQLYQCSVDQRQAARPLDKLEVSRVLWVQADQLDTSNWRFPEQMPLIQHLLQADGGSQ